MQTFHMYSYVRYINIPHITVHVYLIRRSGDGRPTDNNFAIFTVFDFSTVKIQYFT